MKGNRILVVWSASLVLLMACSFVGLATDEVDAWFKFYEGDDYGAFFDIVRAEGGDIVVTGATFHALSQTELGDVLLAKLDLSGSILWEKTYGGDAHDQGLYIESADDGGFLILGETESSGAGGRDLYLVRVDDQGALLWETTYGGSGTEWAKDMLRLADGGYLLVGETNSYGDDFDVLLIRLDEDGSEMWTTTIDAGSNESGTAALEADNGDLLVLAVVSYPGGNTQQFRDSRLFRLDSAGNELWNQLYRGENKQAGDAMAWTADGDIVIVGLSQNLSLTTALFDFWLTRVDAETGESVWNVIEGRQFADDYGISVSVDSGGSFVVAGLGPAFPLLKFSDAGTVTWIRNAAPNESTYSGFAVLLLDDGSYLIPGFRYTPRPGDAFDAVLVRYVER